MQFQLSSKTWDIYSGPPARPPRARGRLLSTRAPDRVGKDDDIDAWYRSQPWSARNAERHGAVPVEPTIEVATRVVP